MARLETDKKFPVEIKDNQNEVIMTNIIFMYAFDDLRPSCLVV